eukprot:Pgem_evm1s16452
MRRRFLIPNGKRCSKVVGKLVVDCIKRGQNNGKIGIGNAFNFSDSSLNSSLTNLE